MHEFDYIGSILGLIFVPYVVSPKQKTNKVEVKAKAKYKACLQEEEFNKILAREKMVVRNSISTDVWRAIRIHNLMGLVGSECFFV